MTRKSGQFGTRGLRNSFRPGRYPILRQGQADNISLNKEKPYANFHASRFKERIMVSIRDALKDIELELQIPKTVQMFENEAIESH